jgi:YD repeat-containing protein
LDVVLPKHKSNVCYGNPVLPLTGVKRESLRLPFALAGFPMSIHYDSGPQLPIAGATDAVPRPESPGFGSFWASSFHRRLRVMSDGGTSGPILSRGDGQVVNVQPGSGFFFSYRAGVSLIQDFRSGIIEEYDPDSGLLKKISLVDGKFVTMTYSDASTPPSIAPAAGYLLAVRDAFGREIKFTYELSSGGKPELDGRVKTIVGPDGEVVTLTFGGDTLRRIDWPDGRAREYLYEDALWPRALTGVKDESQSRYATFTYSPSGLALSTEHAGSVDKFAVEYSREPSLELKEQFTTSTGRFGTLIRTYAWRDAEGVAVKTPSGAVLGLAGDLSTGTPLLSSRTQPAGSGSTASQESRVLDANGYAKVEIDANGNRTCRKFNGLSGVEVDRVEGLPADTACPQLGVGPIDLPEGARRTETTRTLWGREILRAEPGKRTITAYNGDASCAPSDAILPNGARIEVPCAVTEQATTDKSGAFGQSVAIDTSVPARRWEYTYTAQGQVLTAKDPLGNLTTYQYYADTAADHTRGDLAEVSNSAGHRIRYTKYTRGGKLLEEIDPNNVVTSYQYDAMGRLTRSSTGSTSVDYVYYPPGMVKQVRRSSGEVLDYEYDDAHRLTAVKDELGNRIEYGLDNAGNRREERVKDPSGAIRREVRRVFDVLGRVQQVTGRE